MGALAIYLEDEGIPTVQVSLVREHTEALQPPRALWVPFMLGRPLGAPDDPVFQKRVLLAALKLLERSEGPVLEDFNQDAPDSGAADEVESAACPVSFASSPPHATLADTVIGEIEALRMWHDLAVRRRQRTTVGFTQVPVADLARFIGAWAESTPTPSFRDGVPAADALRQACEEIKTYYFEARMAQPGSHSSTSVRSWFWEETTAGRLFLQLHKEIKYDRDPAIADFARNYLVPRAVRYRIDNATSP